MNLIFDIETNPIEFSTGNWLPDVHTVHCIVTKDADTGKVHKFYDTDGLRELGTGTIKQGIQKLGEADVLIGHNIIQFDLPVLRKLFGFEPNGRVHDTLVASRTLYPDREGGHSLSEWGLKLGLSKSDFEDFETFSDEMLRYCERDVEVNHLVYKTLQQEAQDGDWGVALELEHNIARIIAEQERNGFYFDTELANELVKKWSEQIDLIDREFKQYVRKRIVKGRTIKIPFKINGDYTARTKELLGQVGIPEVHGPFCTIEYRDMNLGSPSQQKEVLLELGWKPEKHTKTGSPVLDKSVLSVGKVGQLVLDRNMYRHRRSQVEGFIKLAQQDHRVHGGANPCGTNTSRMRHTRIVNIPKTNVPLGKEIRSLFGVPSGKTLVGYDAAGLELRILAHYIGNKQYNERVTTTDKTRDAHTLAARAAGSSNRDLGKTINYALIYGAGDGRLGSIIGGTTEDGERLRANLYREIPGLDDLVSRAKQAARRGFIWALDGRKLYLRRRVSPLNTLIQGGGSIFMKVVSSILDELVKKHKLEAFKVVDMHDEAQWECPTHEVGTLSTLINQSFESATHFLELRCPQEPEIKVGTTWAETH